MTTRIDTIELTNFRSFAKLSSSFHPELTVLVAPNGGGKTAILDALAIALHSFVAALSAGRSEGRMRLDDVRRVIGPEKTMEFVLPTQIVANGMIADANAQWSQRIVTADADGIRILSKTKQLREIAVSLRQQILDYTERKRPDVPNLPVLCYYGTGRLWNTNDAARPHKQTKLSTPDETSRFRGYADCLSPESSYKFFEEWFGRFSREAQSERESSRASPHRPRERLNAVRIAVGRLLRPSGWQGLEWNFAEDTLVATHAEHGRLPVRVLSDGIRNMIGMVGDLAHRCVRLNPQHGEDAAGMTPGIVLIDEVDMHLHPSWQQQILGALRSAFPRVQFIVTTHSAPVLTTVGAGSVRVLWNDEEGTHAEPPQTSPLARPAGDALAMVLGTDPRPSLPLNEDLHRFEQLVREGMEESSAAQQVYTQLKAAGVQIAESDLALWRFFAAQRGAAR